MADQPPIAFLHAGLDLVGADLIDGREGELGMGLSPPIVAPFSWTVSNRSSLMVQPFRSSGWCAVTEVVSRPAGLKAYPKTPPGFRLRQSTMADRSVGCGCPFDLSTSLKVVDWRSRP
ncbi:MAG: hypothetical protein ABIF71_08435 [Planctomycetota bacterium]